MTNFGDKFEPIDFIALVIVVGCMVSMVIKQDTVFKDILLTITGFYFGHQVNKKK
jgi:hypothetical protein